MRRVEGYGPHDAKLMIVGEAPGREEEAFGRPFVGKTGQMVRNILTKLNCHPDSVYWTNVVKVRPPDNEIKRLKEFGYQIADFSDELWSEINTIKPNCILAFGNTALTALTGMEGIEKYRGSILQSCYASNKVVATIHPASLMHKESDAKIQDWKMLVVIEWDIKRAIHQSSFSDLRLPKRNLIVCRNNAELYSFLNRNSGCRWVSVDIETFRTIPICISFAFNSNEAISVPLFNNLSIREEDLMTRSDILQCWKDIAEFLYDCKIQKIGQNFKFDEKQLQVAVNDTVPIGLTTRGFYFDTMLAFRTLYPELPASLAFQTSVLTEEPYYKEEGKGYNPKRDKVDRLLLYNAKDAVVTYECYERELEELRFRNIEQFYFERVIPLHPFYSRMERRGIKRDAFAKAFLDEKYKDQQQERQIELDGLVSEFQWTGSLNVNSNGMNGQVGKLLYMHMNLPLRKGTDEKTLDALRRNVLKGASPQVGRKRRILELVLEVRKIRKTRGTYIDSKPHRDGNLRTSVRIMLESGRTATGILQPPVTTEKMGIAFQTITKHGDVGADLRSMFVPKEGYIFIEPDLSQAEARVVAVLARDEKLLKMFNYQVDIHSVTATWAAGKPVPNLEAFFNERNEIEARALAKQINAHLKSTIIETERQKGKKGRHAAHYDMGKHEAGIQLGVPESVAGRFLDMIHKTNPNIKGVFHKEIQDFLNQNNRKLTNPFGRERQFLNKWGDDLFKEAYAQIPQSTVSDQVKFAMIRIERRAPWLEILEESHDSFLSQCPIELAEKTYPIIKEELEVPIDFKFCSLGQGELIIPCEIKIGEKNWQEMIKVM